ncbi:hypothetical protein TrVE_jg9826 [Triparma verrucosa]|uniref:EGF-like domain-containing protein n=1 Tax=Triparma verrucosa TaxID=1606542 RepID=A0A9W7C7X3_9STRA|nr:hypothetical protein TrVE_jg9826 [Triparma verrucosa]
MGVAKWLLASYLFGFASARPDIPEIGAYSNPVPPNNNDTVKFGPCDVEVDCPIYQYCYTTPEYAQYEDAAGSCDCYYFYGNSGPECEVFPGGLRPALASFVMVLSIVSFGLWSVTLKQLMAVKAFKARSASGHVVIACMIANWFEILMPLSYVIYTTGSDSSYMSHDVLRGLSFGLCVVFKLGGILEVPIMWMDIVIKSPGMNSDENKAKFKKIALGLRILSVSSGLFIIVLMTSGNTPLAAILVLLLVMLCIVIYQVSSRKLAKMICKNFFELGYSPDDSKFTSSAEKSGHSAAKNILLVSNKNVAVSVLFIVVMVGYSATAKVPEQGKGVLAFIFIHLFLADLAVFQAIFRGYVRLGARKKLQKAGYMKGSSQVTSTSTATTVISKSSVEGL